MDSTREQMLALFHLEQYPLSSAYDPDWVVDNEMGPNALWLTEALCRVMELRPGMRVLDMGCGRAISSIFLAKEYGLQVWATDLWIDAADNWTRVQEAGVADRVFPVHAEAHALPYADDFFDTIVSLDSYQYYGTDVHYLEYFSRFVKPGGQIGIVVPAATVEVEDGLPPYLNPREWYWLHSCQWWRRHWERYPGVRVARAEPLVGGWDLWLRWEGFLDASTRRHRPGERKELEADQGRCLGFCLMVARTEAG